MTHQQGSVFVYTWCISIWSRMCGRLLSYNSTLRFEWSKRKAKMMFTRGWLMCYCWRLTYFRLWSNKAQDMPFDDNSSSSSILLMTGSVFSDATKEGWGLEKSVSLVGFLTAFWPYRRNFDGRTPLLLHTHICWIILSFPSHYSSIRICTVKV